MSEDIARQQLAELFGNEASSDYKDGDPIRFYEPDGKTITDGIYRFSLGSLQVAQRQTVPTYAIEAGGTLRYIPKPRILV